MLTSHPTDARYYASRREARAAARKGERVIRLGAFSAGSFGCYPPLKPNGQPAGGPNALVCVWMVTADQHAGRC